MNKSLLSLFSLVIILLLLVASYNIVAPQVLSSIKSPSQNPVNCVDSGVSENLNLSDKTGRIDVKTSTNTTRIIIPSDVETNLSFNFRADVESRKEVEYIGRDKYRSYRGNTSVIEYETENLNLDSSDIKNLDNNYSILPKTSNSSYDLSKERSIFGQTVYLGEDYFREEIKIGCQEIEFFSPSGEIDTKKNVIEDVSGRIPFEENYSEIEVVVTKVNIKPKIARAAGLAIDNKIYLEKSNITNSLLVHEYIHTRQDYSDIPIGRYDNWYMEGSAEYYTLKSLYESGYINRYEYLYEISRRWNQLNNTSTEEVYNEDRSNLHYSAGPQIFREYENEFGKITNNSNNKKLSEYYKDYDSSSGVYSSKASMVLSKTLGFLHLVHKKPVSGYLYLSLILTISLGITLIIVSEVFYRARNWKDRRLVW